MKQRAAAPPAPAKQVSGLLRSILAIAAGDLIFAGTAVLLFRILGRDPHTPSPVPFMALSIAIGVVAAAVGGWVTAALANHHRRLHAVALGVLIALGALVSLIMRPGAGAIWTQVSAICLMAPAAVLGSWPWWGKDAR